MADMCSGTQNVIRSRSKNTVKSKTYEEFVEKFKPKKTTDDCYTPRNL